MKKLFYTIYAVIFRICRLFPVKRGRVALVSPHNADFNDSLGAVKAELERHGDYDIKLITRRDIELSKNPAKLIKGAFRFFFVSSYRLATAQYVFLNDNFMPLAYINFSPETKVVQLWHAEGVFKRFGLCSALPPEIEVLARTEDGEIMAMQHTRYPVVGIQFHPESVYTEHGKKIIENFLTMSPVSEE